MWAATAVAVVAALGLLVDQNTMRVDGLSMLPSLHPGQLLMVNRLAAPAHGEVMVFRHSTSTHDDYIVKRIIGMPGDLVLVDNGQVFVNGVQLDEPYVLALDDYTYPIERVPVRVPDDAYFVLGDNRPQSADSHQGWFVTSADVVGQALPLPIAGFVTTP
jgi:signal peptidase I